MNTETNIPKHPGGRPPIYNANFHPDEIIRLMRDEGLFAVEIAKEWDIDANTLPEWAKTYPEFSVAYNRAKQLRTAYWLKIGRSGIVTNTGTNFNAQLYSQIMKYDGNNMDERVVQLPELATCKTFCEQSTVIQGALACGKITLKEANSYVDIIGKMAKIDEVTELRQMLEEIEVARKQGR